MWVDAAELEAPHGVEMTRNSSNNSPSVLSILRRPFSSIVGLRIDGVENTCTSGERPSDTNDSESSSLLTPSWFRRVVGDHDFSLVIQ
jgi:hypothetical protein